MGTKVKVSSRNQIVIPAEIRKALCIEPGDHLLISVRDGLFTIMPARDGVDRPIHEGCVDQEPAPTSIVKVSSKNQIVVPSVVRKKLGIKSGDYLLVSIWDQSITMLREPESYVDALRGLHKEIWEGVDVEEYINQERDAWED